MNAQELRIGNWLWDAKNKRYCQVFRLTSGNDYSITCSYGRSYEHSPKDSNELKGIPLTEEILLKAGFEKDGYGSFVKSINPFDTGHKNLAFADDYLYMREGGGHPKDDHICTLWNKDLKKDFFLHQLQNLYYALTGEELIINL